jgi:hypothetical protein
VTREELEHAIRAACDVAQDDEVYVFGSQAILGQFPDAPAELRQSAEVDVSPRTRVDRVDAIDGAIGELSAFHREFGFYVHGLPIDAAKLPARWQRRVIAVQDPIATNGKTGLCLEPHDLAASKLAAFRDKDRDFVRVLLRDGLIKPTVLRARIRALPVTAGDRKRLYSWLEITARELKAKKR